jgi:hypothetical protein
MGRRIHYTESAYGEPRTDCRTALLVVAVIIAAMLAGLCIAYVAYM